MNRASTTKLILVDGLPGAGKSATAQRLWLHLLANGHRARWFHEHQADHPVCGYDEIDELLQGGPEEFGRQVEARWAAFASEGSEDGITILEGSLFQITLGRLLGLGAAPQEAEAVCQRIAAHLHGLSPLFIYLTQEDVVGALRRVCDEREGWEEGIVELIGASPYGQSRRLEGFAGMVQFFTHQQQVAGRLFAELPWRKLAIECSAREWEQYYGQMADALELGPLQPLDRPFAELLPYLGRYRERGGTRECVLTSDGGTLYFNQGYYFTSRLLRRNADAFCFIAYPLELVFQRDGDGRVEGMSGRGKISNHWIKDSQWIKV